mgnify:CR=1 FL=1
MMLQARRPQARQPAPVCTCSDAHACAPAQQRVAAATVGQPASGQRREHLQHAVNSLFVGGRYGGGRLFNQMALQQHKRAAQVGQSLGVRLLV